MKRCPYCKSKFIPKTKRQITCGSSSCRAKRHRYVKRRNKLQRSAASSISRRKRYYGISQQDFDLLLERQGGHCRLCPETKNLRIDHDHACCPRAKGKTVTCGRCIRGLLCSPCNMRVGVLERDYEWLELAISYILEPPLDMKKIRGLEPA